MLKVLALAAMAASCMNSEGLQGCKPAHLQILVELGPFAAAAAVSDCQLCDSQPSEEGQQPEVADVGARDLQEACTWVWQADICSLGPAGTICVQTGREASCGACSRGCTG